jgi:hypothetical protein
MTDGEVAERQARRASVWLVALVVVATAGACSKKEPDKPWHNRYEVDAKTGEIKAIPIPTEPPSIKCFLMSRTDTGKRKYCGKACYQAVYAYTYQCEGGGYVTQEKT